MTPAVLNIRDLGPVGSWPADVVRIDRRTPYGNPARLADYRSLQPVDQRAAAIAYFGAYARSRLTEDVTPRRHT